MIKTVYSQTLVSHVVNVSELQPACGEMDLFLFIYFFSRCVYSCVFDTGGLQQQIHDEFQTLLSLCVCVFVSVYFLLQACLGSQRPAFFISVKL